MDANSISSALASIKAATDIVRFIKDTDTRLEKAESKLKLADVISSLADAKIELAEVQQLMSDKEAEIKRLQERLHIKEKLHWQEPYYWLSDGSNREGPFCQHCYDKNGELIRLQGKGKQRREGAWYCTACKHSYVDKDYVPPQPAPRQRRSSTWSLRGY